MSNKPSKRRSTKQADIVEFPQSSKPLSIKRKRLDNVRIVPKNIAQEDYLIKLNNDSNRIVFAVGPAGTGKTLIATLKAIELLKSDVIDRIIITRPAVAVGEDLGYLPGTLQEKMAPWTRPIFDVFHEYFSVDETEAMLHEGILEIAPLAYMRGRTFKNSVILFDEAQNTTIEQMKMALTRIGEGSRMFVTGDLRQTDIEKEQNGLFNFMNMLDNNPKAKYIAQCKFSVDHVERDVVVSEILNMYGEI